MTLTQLHYIITIAETKSLNKAAELLYVSQPSLTNAVKELEGTIVPHDTVIDELRELAAKQDIESEDLAVAMAAYMLGFGSYRGFKK